MTAFMPTTKHQPGAGPVLPRPGRRGKPALLWIAEHALLILCAILFLVPIAFVLLTSGMSPEQTFTASLWPNPWDLSGYARAFEVAPLTRWFGNSLLYAALATVFMLASSVPAAYVLSKTRFKLANTVFLLVIVAMLLPPQVTIVPLYVMWAKIGLTGTLWPLILPNLLGDAFSIFLLRQFFLTIPPDYVDAARVDGNGEWGVLVRIIVPMARPGIAAASIFSFFHAWNDYFGPLIYASENTDSWPVAYGLAMFHGTHGTDWATTMAVTVLVAAPIVIVFLFAQKAFVEGITFTGVKG